MATSNSIPMSYINRLNSAYGHGYDPNYQGNRYGATTQQRTTGVRAGTAGVGATSSGYDDYKAMAGLEDYKTNSQRQYETGRTHQQQTYDTGVNETNFGHTKALSNLDYEHQSGLLSQQQKYNTTAGDTAYSRMLQDEARRNAQAKQTGDLAYTRQQNENNLQYGRSEINYSRNQVQANRARQDYENSPSYQMQQYGLNQARRTPDQKGADLGSELNALAGKTGLSLLGSQSSSDYGTGAGHTIQPNFGMGQESSIAPVDTSAAQAGAFARAKDQVGLETQGSIAGLRSALGGRGMLGGGAEYRGLGNVANQGQQELGNTSRSLAEQESQRASQEGQANYQGQIAQRGQNLNAAEAGYEGLIAQRGQNIAAQEASRARQQQQLQGLLSALHGTQY